MIELFSHDVSFIKDEDTEDIFIICGKSWENEVFKLYLKNDDAKDLMWQMSYYINNQEFE